MRGAKTAFLNTQHNIHRGVGSIVQGKVQDSVSHVVGKHMRRLSHNIFLLPHDQNRIHNIPERGLDKLYLSYIISKFGFGGTRIYVNNNPS